MFSLTQFKKLFEPIKIGNMWIKNRIAMAPMGIVYFVAPDGSLTKRAIAYYEERAKGGVGLIITGLTRVENKIENLTVKGRHVLPILESFKHVPPMAELTERVHHYGTRIFIQLTGGVGRVAPTIAIMEGMQPVGPSEIPCYWVPTVKTRPLEKEEIKELIKAFARAAELAYIAGFDGIEIHGHEGYLIDQFTTAVWNRRDDEYGGSFENRMRLPIEILHTIKDATDKHFPVVYRFGVKHFVKGYNRPALPDEEFHEVGRDVEEGLRMAKVLEEAGYDALHVDAGCYDSWFMAHPPEYLGHGPLVEFAAMVKKVVKIPVIAVGRLDIPELAERVLAEGKADMIAIGRGLLADPYWPKKVRRGEVEDIRPCIGCHECLYRIIELARPLGCAVNPLTGKEYEIRIEPAREKKKVVVIGGGLAGMEAARVAKLRGHDVILFEKEKELGGHLLEARTPEFKADMERLRKWYVRQLEKLGVVVRLGEEATVEKVLAEKPDVIIVATGSKPFIPSILGVDKPHVKLAVDILRKGETPGHEVVVIGAGLVGLEVALWLALKGKKVKVVEARGCLMLNMSRANWLYLLTKLERLGVEIFLGTKVKEIKDDAVVVEGPEGEEELKCDTVILATGMVPNRKLYEELSKVHPEVYLIGDALGPRRIKDAIWDGFQVALSI